MKQLYRLPVAQHLTDDEYKTLLEVYANHSRSMKLKDRKFYNLSTIVEVKKNLEEKCLHVKYENGEW